MISYPLGSDAQDLWDQGATGIEGLSHAQLGSVLFQKNPFLDK